MSQFGVCQYSNNSVQKLYITKWSSGITPNINTDGEITGLNDLPGGWSGITLNTAVATFSQSMNPPNPNGINYTETLQILVPHFDISKWLDLVEILVDRYIVVFQDGNSQWFCFGWRFGSKVRAYTLEENQYAVTFRNEFTSALMTSITESYVTSNIL